MRKANNTGENRLGTRLLQSVKKYIDTRAKPLKIHLETRAKVAVFSL